MPIAPLPIAPLRFLPLPMPRIWGGTRLSSMLNKPIADEAPIGESWELSCLEGNASVVADGPLAGHARPELASQYTEALLGDIAAVDNAFPLLIKFLDAQQPLSVQVHPKPSESLNVAVKHEAWYIVHAEPNAKVYIGLNSGVTQTDRAEAATKPRISELIQSRPARTGDCFYLPSGTLHALGKGLLVAEVQTPSDVTYRIYDWNRVDASEKPRALHIEAALANIRHDVTEADIVQPRRRVADAESWRQRVCQCDRFAIDELTPATSIDWSARQPTFAVLMVLQGSASLSGDGFSIHARPGDTLLLPAALRVMHVDASVDFKCLDIVPGTCRSET